MATKVLSTDTWQKLIPLGLAEVKVLLSTYKLQVAAHSPLTAAAAITDPAELGAAKVTLQQRGLLEAAGVKPGPDLLAVRGALEVLTKPSRELMVAKLKPTQSEPQALTFGVGPQQSCLFFATPDALHVGAAIPNTQLFSILSRDLKGAKDDDFKPWDVLPMHYHLLLALRHAGLINPKKAFSRTALSRLVAQLKLAPKEGAGLIVSAVKAGVLLRAGAGFVVSPTAAALMGKLGSGEMTELVVRELTSGPADLPRSILFAGAAGHRIRCDRPSAKGPKSVPVLTFVPVTQESLGSSVGKWLGLSN